jgi:hypothetical protein
MTTSKFSSAKPPRTGTPRKAVAVRENKGLHMCPFCKGRKVAVLDSRPTENGHIRRSRQCVACEKRWTTYEIPSEELIQLSAAPAPAAEDEKRAELGRLAISLMLEPQAGGIMNCWGKILRYAFLEDKS